ncbi:MAG: hypothetical protein IJ501_04045 [Bacilli bacterium]|nr:hypothetical protein [Bacilli bacterium]
MKNKVVLVCGALVLILFLAFGTYAWYLYFLRASGGFEVHNNNNLRYGDIVLKDDGNSVYDADADSIEDDLVNHVIPYKFRVINEGNKEGNYYLYIEDLPVNAINDGCTYDTLLVREQLRYQLKLNGEVIKEDFLSNINDNILDKRTMEGNSTNHYELRIYIHDTALDWMGKHYHYKVVLNK